MRHAATWSKEHMSRARAVHTGLLPAEHVHSVEHSSVGGSACQHCGTGVPSVQHTPDRTPRCVKCRSTMRTVPVITSKDHTYTSRPPVASTTPPAKARTYEIAGRSATLHTNGTATPMALVARMPKRAPMRSPNVALSSPASAAQADDIVPDASWRSAFAEKHLSCWVLLASIGCPATLTESHASSAKDQQTD